MTTESPRLPITFGTTAAPASFDQSLTIATAAEDAGFTSLGFSDRPHDPILDGWIALSLILYGVTGAFWIPVVFMQIRMRNLAEAAVQAGTVLPPAYHRLFWTWFAFGFPAFAAVLAIVWLMTSRPMFSLF